MTTIEFPELKEVGEALKAKRKELHDLYEGAWAEDGTLDTSKIKGLDGDSQAKVDEIRKLNDEIDDLAKKDEKNRALLKGAQHSLDYDEDFEPGDDRHHGPVVKSFGKAFAESNALKGYQGGGQGPAAELDVELKTLMETGAGWAPATVRGPRVVDYATRPVQMMDIIPTSPTDQTAIRYMEETTFTNNAAERNEGAVYGEAALALTERTDPVQSIGVWLPVTDEQLEDIPGIQSYIDNRLPFMVKQRLDSQVIVGNGTAPNISGYLDRSNIQTQAKGSDPTPDAVYKAMTKVEVTGQSIPEAYVTHPNDWQEVRLLRTSDGIYIWGSPADAGPERIWGLPVVKVQGITEGTGLVGAFAAHSELRVKKGIVVEVTNSHSDYFIYGKQAIRATMRVALAVYRPVAFCQVTGI